MVRTNTRFDVLKEPEKTKEPRQPRRRADSNATSSRANKKPRAKPQQKLFTMSNADHHNAFPELASSQKSPSSMPTTMDFAEATRPEELTGNIVADVDPGLVILTRASKKPQYKDKNQPATTSTPQEDELSRKGLDASQEASLYMLTERWQKYRDMQNELYPNTSLYMNEKSLLDPLSDDCYDSDSDYSESDESIEDPTDYDDIF